LDNKEIVPESLRNLEQFIFPSINLILTVLGKVDEAPKKGKLKCRLF